MDETFVTQLFKIRTLTLAQRRLDRAFAEESLDLKKKLYSKEITLDEYWALYKDSLKRSEKKNEQTLEELLGNADQGMATLVAQSEGTD